MPPTTDCLQRAETQLDLLTRGHEHTTLRRWAHASNELAHATITRPGQLHHWLRTRPTPQADQALRALVQLAQKGDGPALLTTLICLAPGIRALARTTRTKLDETMSEITLGILEYPHTRRNTIASGLLLDARNRITRTTKRTPTPTTPPHENTQPTTPTSDHDPYGHTPPGPTTAERILTLLCQARHHNILNHDDTQLIVDTRLNDQPITPTATRLGITPTAAYQRRTRAEHRLRNHPLL